MMNRKKKPDRLSVWFRQIRGPFLILSVVLVQIGLAAAWRDGVFHLGHSLLLLAGVLLAHISVNLLNEYYDYQSGIDSLTRRTPFSGGSGLLQRGITSSNSVKLMGYFTLLLSGLIGFYFCLRSGWIVLLFMIGGGLAIRFYTSHFAKYLIGEFISGLTLGTFVVFGVYYSITKNLSTEIVFLSIPPGILTMLLLFLNEFPDVEADQKGGRYHLVIHFGRKKCSRIYAVIFLLVYIWIGLIPWISDIPPWILLSFLTLPLALKAIVIVLKKYDHFESFIPALGMNIGAILLTDIFLALGLLL